MGNFEELTIEELQQKLSDSVKLRYVTRILALLDSANACIKMTLEPTVDFVPDEIARGLDEVSQSLTQLRHTAYDYIHDEIENAEDYLNLRS